MNKKGFTLAETIGVIIVLGLIAVITVPFVDNYIKESREKALKSNINKILEAAENWNMKYGSMNGCDNEYGCVLELDDLKKTEFLSDEKIMNPKTKEELDVNVFIKKNDNGIYEYKLGYYVYLYRGEDEEQTTREKPTNKNVYIKLLCDFEKIALGWGRDDIFYEFACLNTSNGEICASPKQSDKNHQEQIKSLFESSQCRYENGVLICSNSNYSIELGYVGAATKTYNDNNRCFIELGNSIERTCIID